MNNIWSNIKKSKVFLKNCKKEIIIILVLSLFTSIITSVIPTFNGNLINKLLKGKYNLVIFFAILVGVLQILFTIFSMLESKNNLKFRRKFRYNIQKKVTRAILDLNIDVYSIYGQGAMINKLKNDSRNIVVFLNNIKEGFFSLFTSIFIIIYIFYLNSIIGICYIISIILILIFQMYGIRKSVYYRKKYLELNDSNTNLIGDIIKGVKDIKTLKLKNNFLEKANDSFDKIGEYEYKSSIYLEYTSKISNFLGIVFFGIIVLISIILIKNKMLTTATFIIIFMYKNSIFTFSNKVANILSNLEHFSLSMERIYSILDYKKESFGIKSLTNCKGKISLKNIDFGYNENLIFNDFNLEIEPNSLTVIVGENGAGKSTLFGLLTKIINPLKGSIYLDNIDISELKEEDIRNNISLVTQQPYIFDLSIKENLDMMDDDLEHIKNVCKLVGLDEKINSMEKGYNTKIRSDGTNLSGGEKQKLAIARALLSKSKVLLFDEITNNLDSKSTLSIIKLIKKLKGKYTIIMITHNLEVMQSADRIIMLNKGNIIGDGKNEYLLKNNKSYKKMFEKE